MTLRSGRAAVRRVPVQLAAAGLAATLVACGGAVIRR